MRLGERVLLCVSVCIVRVLPYACVRKTVGEDQPSRHLPETTDATAVLRPV